jgi:hypothetical protein
MTFEGANVGELLNFIDQKFGDKGCLLLEYKTIGIWNYEKMFLRQASVTSCTIVYHKSDKEKCDVYLWGTGGGVGYVGIDYGTEKSIRDTVAKEISTYAVEQLKLRKTYDADEFFQT